MRSSVLTLAGLMAVVRGVVIDPRAWPTSAPALVNRAARDGLYDVVFNYTFTDMSPMLVYTPTSSGSIDAAWNNSYIGSAPVAAGLDVVGLGTSAHTSSAPNAYLTFGFVGTGVYLFGETRDPAVADSTSTDAQIRLTVDGVNYDFAPSTMRDALLGFKDKMGWGAHTAVLSVLSGTVSLHNVSVLTNISTEASSFATVKQVQTPLYNGTVADPSFDLSGDWYGLGSIGGDESQATTVLNGRPGASLTWALPANSSYVVINGTTATTSAYYTVTVSPSPPGGHESFTGNVLQGFTNPAELFMSPLDPNEIYNVTLSVRSDSAGVVGVHSVLTYSSEYSSDSPVSSSGGRAVSTPTSSSAESPTAVPAKSGGSSSVGPVVGGVVGGVGGLLLVALAVYLLLRRKKTPPKPTTGPGDTFVVDDDPQNAPYPYQMTEQEQNRLRASQMSYASTTRLTDPASTNAGIIGFTPTSPTSPTLPATTTLSNMLGLGVVNADEPDSLGTNARDPAVAAYNVAAQKRAAAQRAARDPSHPPQEYDAGRWTAEAQDAVQAMASIPPSYDPSWAGDYPLMTPQPTGTDSGRRVSSRTRPSTISDITPMELDETPVDTPPGELVTEASPGPYTPQSDRTN